MSDKPENHPCLMDDGEYDHDWKFIVDWYGDPDVVCGTADCSRWECQKCGEEDYEMDPPGYEDYSIEE